MPGPAYRIETERLVMRCWDPRDTRAFVEAIETSRDHLREYMIWARDPVPFEQRLDWVRKARGKFDLGDDFAYAMFDRGETRLLGGTGLHTRVGPDAREIGYWLRADAVGKGLATEAAAAMTRVAFEVDKVKRVEIHVDPRNAKSAAIAARLNFRLDGTLRRRYPDPLGLRDTQHWSLFDDEYPGSPATRVSIRAFDAIGDPIDIGGSQPPT